MYYARSGTGEEESREETLLESREIFALCLKGGRVSETSEKRSDPGDPLPQKRKEVKDALLVAHLVARGRGSGLWRGPRSSAQLAREESHDHKFKVSLSRKEKGKRRPPPDLGARPGREKTHPLKLYC